MMKFVLIKNLQYIRNLYGYNSIVVVLNFGPKPENVPLRSYFANLSERSKVKLSSINSERNIGLVYDINNIFIKYLI